MIAKVTAQIVPPNLWSDAATSESDKEEIKQHVEEFLKAFEAEYRQKIAERKNKKNK